MEALETGWRKGEENMITATIKVVGLPGGKVEVATSWPLPGVPEGLEGTGTLVARGEMKDRELLLTRVIVYLTQQGISRFEVVGLVK